MYTWLVEFDNHTRGFQNGDRVQIVSLSIYCSWDKRPGCWLSVRTNTSRAIDAGGSRVIRKNWG